MANMEKWLGKIHQGDCVEGLKRVPDGSVDLAFADPPFNIGYKSSSQLPLDLDG